MGQLVDNTLKQIKKTQLKLLSRPEWEWESKDSIFFWFMCTFPPYKFIQVVITTSRYFNIRKRLNCDCVLKNGTRYAVIHLHWCSQNSIKNRSMNGNKHLFSIIYPVV